MRVLFLSHRLPYAPNRGDRIRAYHLLKTLSRRSEVHVLSLVHDDEEASHVGDLEGVVASTTIARVPAAANRLRGVLALAGRRPLTHVLLDSPDIPPALESICRVHPPDAVLSFCSGVAQYLAAPPLASVPAVLDMVDVDSAKWAQMSSTARFPKSWIFRREARVLARFEAAASRRAMTTLVVNERERHLLASLAPTADVRTVENGIDADYFRSPDPPSPAPSIVFCGVMNYAPNESAAIWMAERVWPAIRRAIPDARFTIVGAEPTAAVQALAKRPGISVTGSVTDVRPYLWSAAVSVAPIAIARGLQNKVLEALAAGLPCVVTPAVAEGLPPAARGACRTAADATGFADAVIALLAMAPDERRRLAADAHVEALDWSVQLADVASILEAAARSRISGQVS